MRQNVDRFQINFKKIRPYRCAKIVLDEISKSNTPLLLLATHNANSVLTVIPALNSLPKSTVLFAQLSGMGEKLSVPLSHHGHPTLKLVPCGSVSDVLPWLARRMQENASALERMGDDRRLIGREIRRRVLKL